MGLSDITVIKLLQLKTQWAGNPRSQLRPSSATYWPKPGSHPRLPSPPSVVSHQVRFYESQQSLLSVGRQGLTSSLRCLHRDDCISLLTSFRSSGLIHLQPSQCASPTTNCVLSRHLVSFNGSLWRCGHVGSPQSSTQYLSLQPCSILTVSLSHTAVFGGISLLAGSLS